MLLGLTSLFILACAPAQYLGRQQDDLIYVIASHALARGGYRLFTTPGSPPITMMTPGLPLTLLPITFLFGERFAAYQIFCALILAAAPWLIWLWLRRELGDTTAALAAALFGTSPIVLSQAGTVMTEGVYAAGAAAFLYYAARSPGAAGGWLLFLSQLRPAGLSLFPAALARPIWSRRWKDAAVVALPAAAAMTYWFWWSGRVAGGMEKMTELALFYRGGSPADILAVAVDNARYYLASLGSCYLPRALAQGAAAPALGAIFALLVLEGLRRAWVRDAAHPAAWMLAGAFLMHGVWAWHYERYLIAILPWLLWAAALALGRSARFVLAALLAAQIIFQSRAWLSATSWRRVELAQTYDWIQANTGPADILASAIYVRDGFYAKRPALPLPEGTADIFAGWLARGQVKYVVWEDNLDIGLSLGSASANHRLLDQAGEYLLDRKRYRLVYENRGERSRIYAFENGR